MGTPLTKKLGLKAGQTAWFTDMPASVRAEIGDVGVLERDAPIDGLDAAHLFVTERVELERLLGDSRGGSPRTEWPTTAAKVTTDITEDTIREVALPMGWVDVKVCAVDETGSGLKLVIRRQLR